MIPIILITAYITTNIILAVVFYFHEKDKAAAVSFLLFGGFIAIIGLVTEVLETIFKR